MALPRGFQFSGYACGIKKSGRLDLAIISTHRPAVVAGVYTQNVVRAASIDWNRGITPSEQFRAVVINSGNANACTGKQGVVDNQAIAGLVAGQLEAQPDQILVLSTGIIGRPMPMEKIKTGLPIAVGLCGETKENFESASQAILTTDKGPKTMDTTLQIGGDGVCIAGMAKGAGMIGPNMATMLAVVLTDARLTPDLAQKLLNRASAASFNRISVEGHTSTNDALLLISSGDSKVEIRSESEIDQFATALDEACIDLAKRIPADGEGATHLLAIQVTGAQSDSDADRVARTVALSALVKTAITGSDPNWGRIVSAAGYSNVAMEIDQTDLTINGHCVFKNGQPIEFDAGLVSRAMAAEFETRIDLKIGSGSGSAIHWTSDLTVEYVRFNSEYHT
jgi:glutamate N-acetyltransferase/amino-acid N-acetyltransferase